MSERPTKHYARGTDPVVSTSIPADHVDLKHRGYTEFESAEDAKNHVTANKAAQTRAKNAEEPPGDGDQKPGGQPPAGEQKPSTGGPKTSGRKSDG